jgi:hypothetical protein
MHEDEIVIEQRAVEENEHDIAENSDCHSVPSISISPIVVIIQLKHIASLPLLSYSVNYENEQEVNGCSDSVPTYHFVEDMWEPGVFIHKIRDCYKYSEK